MNIVIIIVAVLVVALLVLALLAPRRASRRSPADGVHDDPVASGPPSDRSGEPTDPVRTDPVRTDAAPTAAAWDTVAGTSEGTPDPAGPPAAIHITITGTHPWAPLRSFFSELRGEGYVPTVELPDLVVMRDLERSPVTVREPAGPPGHLVVTTAPEHMADTLQTLVRSLLTGAFSIEGTDGRDVHLADDHGTRIHLTVTELALN